MQADFTARFLSATSFETRMSRIPDMGHFSVVSIVTSEASGSSPVSYDLIPGLFFNERKRGTVGEQLEEMAG